MSQALALAVLAGIISGGLGLAPLSGSFGLVLISYFVQLPILLAGLTMGMASAIVAVVTAGVISILIAGLLPALIYLAAFALRHRFGLCAKRCCRSRISRLASSGIRRGSFWLS